MYYEIVLLLLVFTLSFLLTWGVRKWTIKKAILDLPNERSSHSVPTPRGGGIAIAIIWFAGLIYFKISNRIDTPLFLALLCGLPLSVAGFLDDVLQLKPKIRFIIQFTCAGLGLFFLGGMHYVNLGFITFENVWLFTPIALFGIVWLINLFNFLDGIDGYISTEVIFIGTAVFFLFHDLIALMLAVTVLGFLCWNWQKAKIFMGDVGSTLLGYTIAIFAIYYQNTETTSIVIWAMLTSLFWVDASITLLRRIQNKESLGQAHRKHAYQRIVQAGFSHQKTVLWGIVLNLIILSLIALSIKYPDFLLLFAIINVILLMGTVKWIDSKKPFERT